MSPTRAALFWTACAILAACTSALNPTGTSTETQTVAPAAPAQDAAAEKPDPPPEEAAPEAPYVEGLALINGIPITQKAFDAAYAPLKEARETRRIPSPFPASDEKRALFDRLIKRELLRQAMDKAAISIPDAEVQAMIDQPRKFPRMSLTKEEIWDSTRHHLLVRKLLATRGEAFSVTEVELRTAYLKDLRLYLNRAKAPKTLLEPFDEIRPELEKSLARDWQRKATDALIETLRAQATIEIRASFGDMDDEVMVLGMRDVLTGPPKPRASKPKGAKEAQKDAWKPSPPALSALPAPPTRPQSTAADSKAACNKGDQSACADLAEANLQGRGIRQNLKAAADLHKRACDKGHLASCTRLGHFAMYARGVPYDPKLAAELFTRACEGHDNDGCMRLADLYERGMGVEMDEDKATEMTTAACEAGQGQACHLLAISARIDDDFEAAARLTLTAAAHLHKACASGHAPDCTTLADLYRFDYFKMLKAAALPPAIALTQRACALGDADGCATLAWLLSTSDDAGSFKAVERACGLGNTPSCFTLGTWQESGRGTPSDIEAARTSYELGCAFRDARACVRLAAFHFEGIGVPKNRAKAQKLLKDPCKRRRQLACNALKILGGR